MILLALLVAGQAPPPFQPPGPPMQVESEYRLSGAKELRPVEIRDDGMRTYLRWTREQELPAVFALDSYGREEMIDGHMRGEFYTIDRVVSRLVFRMDKRAARAERRTVEE